MRTYPPLLAQVVRCCLENAVSVAKTFLLSDVIIVDKVDEKEAALAAMGEAEDYGY